MAGAFSWDYQKGELVEGEVLIDLSYAIFSKTQSDWQAVEDAAHPGIRFKDESNEWDWVQKFASRAAGHGLAATRHRGRI